MQGLARTRQCLIELPSGAGPELGCWTRVGESASRAVHAPSLMKSFFWEDRQGPAMSRPGRISTVPQEAADSKYHSAIHELRSTRIGTLLIVIESSNGCEWKSYSARTSHAQIDGAGSLPRSASPASWRKCCSGASRAMALTKGGRYAPEALGFAETRLPPSTMFRGRCLDRLFRSNVNSWSWPHGRRMSDREYQVDAG